MCDEVFCTSDVSSLSSRVDTILTRVSSDNRAPRVPYAESAVAATQTGYRAGCARPAVSA